MARKGRYRTWMAVGSLAAMALLVPRWLLWLRFSSRIHSLGSAPSAPVAIVFGAGLRRDGTPTLVLADRVATAAELFFRGQVQRLLLTGSVRGPAYDEPGAMAALAVGMGVPTDALWVDLGGLRTAASCQRARDVFGVRDAVLVTQTFHLPRALALCDAVGIRAQGVAADRSRYSTRSRRWWELREYPASLVALLESAYQHVSRRPEGLSVDA